MVRNLESTWKWKKAEKHRAVSFCLVFDVTARTTTPIVGGERLQCSVTCINAWMLDALRTGPGLNIHLRFLFY